MTRLPWMRKALPKVGLVLALGIVLGLGVGGLFSGFDIDVVSYDIKIHQGTDWLVVRLELRNGTPFVAREVVIHTRHFDGESWLDWLHGTSAVDMERGKVRQVRWVYSTRANAKEYLAFVGFEPMKVEVKVNWTVFGMFRRGASRVISL